MKLYTIIQSTKYYDKFDKCIKTKCQSIGIPLNSKQSARLMIESLRDKDQEIAKEYNIQVRHKYYIHEVNI